MAINILEKVDMHRLGEKLQIARKQRGLTQADAAEIINAARTTIVAIEKGERKIKPCELIDLAKAYGREVSYFVKTELGIQSFEVQFRAAFRRSEEDDSNIQSVIIKFEDLCQNYLELEKIMSSPLPRNYPMEYDLSGIPLDTAAESIALSERQRLNLGDGPLPLLRDVLEQSVGIRVFYIDMPSSYSEIYAYDENLGACMAININHPEERRRWSIAHGYLHFLAHRRKTVVDHVISKNQRIPTSEQFAELFAPQFLMPSTGLFRRFSEISKTQGTFTPTNLFTLAHYYGVSVEALVYRLEGLKLLPSGTWERLSDRGIKVREIQQKLGINELAQRADILPIHYQHLAIEALDQGLITEGRFADYLSVDRLTARRLYKSLQEYTSGLFEDTINMDLRKS